MINCSSDILSFLQKTPTAVARNEVAACAYILFFSAFISIFLWEEPASLRFLSLVWSPPFTPVLSPQMYTLCWSYVSCVHYRWQKKSNVSSVDPTEVTSSPPPSAGDCAFMHPISLNITALGGATLSTSSFPKRLRLLPQRLSQPPACNLPNLRCPCRFFQLDCSQNLIRFHFPQNLNKKLTKI